MYDNYPPGAAHDQNAPYNEPLIPERDFDVEVTITMSKVVTITTDNYVPEYDDEDGHTYANTENTEWDKEFENSGHFTIADLIEELKGFSNEMDITLVGRPNINTWLGQELPQIFIVDMEIQDARFSF